MSSSTVTLEDSSERFHFILGLCLAVSSSLFIGSSFVLKKVGLIRLSRCGHPRASAGGYGYLKDWVWWAGLLLMGTGEAANMAAYAYQPAALVTPLGALSVLVTAVLSSRFLKERLNLISMIGCLLCVLGSTVIVLHSPPERNVVHSIDQLATLLLDTPFVTYVCFVALSSGALVVMGVPRYGRSSIFVYLLICSLIGSLSVMSCRALGLAVREAFANLALFRALNNSGAENSDTGRRIVSGSNDNNDRKEPSFNDATGNARPADVATTGWIAFLSLLSTAFCVSVQMNYLNKALDIFDTSIVTPVYYVLFSFCVLLSSGVLFGEFVHTSLNDALGLFAGLLTTICAVFLLNMFKDFDISLPSTFVHTRVGTGGGHGRLRAQQSYYTPLNTSCTVDSAEFDLKLVKEDVRDLHHDIHEKVVFNGGTDDVNFGSQRLVW